MYKEGFSFFLFQCFVLFHFSISAIWWWHHLNTCRQNSEGNSLPKACAGTKVPFSVKVASRATGTPLLPKMLYCDGLHLCAHVDFSREKAHKLLSNSQQSPLPKMFRITDLPVNQPSDPILI